MNERIESALAEYRERAEDLAANASGLKERLADLRREAPTLTTALVAVVFLAGFAGGWFASRPFTRWAVNSEWRAKIAASSKSVRAVMQRGSEEAAATDDEILKSLETTDAELLNAERALKRVQSLPSADRCTVPADCLR